MSSQNSTHSSSADTSFDDGLPVQPMHQGNIRKPWQKKILQEYRMSLDSDILMKLEEIMLLQQIT